MATIIGRQARRESGIALVSVMVVLFTMATLGLLFLSVTTSSFVRTRSDRENTRSLYFAEAGVEQGKLHIKDTFALMGTDPTTDWVEIQVEDAVDGWTAEVEYMVSKVSSWTQTIQPDGSWGTSCYYEIASRTTNLPENQAVRELIEVKLIPLFQYAIFYDENDLELLPGPNMSVWGRVHSNKDIYLSCGGTLSIDTTSLTSASKIYRRRKLVNEAEGTVRITDDGGYYREMTKNPRFDSTHPNWLNGSQSLWGGVVKSKVHGVAEVATPALQSIEPGGFYDQEAGLRVIDGHAYIGQVDITSDLPSGTITSSSFWNGREKKTVQVYNIDVAKLGQSGYFPANGLIYATRSDASPAKPYGFRLQNAQELPGALTFVSNDPVYTWKDYNSIHKKPAAIICDAINHLSNSWKDADNGTSNMKTASNTTVNAAFISGSYESTGDDYCGGLENYSRLLENWSNKSLTVRGSYVYLWHSQIAQGRWQGTGGYYNPPIRDWGYDTDFNDPNNLPPFTPRSIHTKTAIWGRG
jgi:hypothetical protein